MSQPVGALDDPESRDHLEPRRGRTRADDFDVDAEAWRRVGVVADLEGHCGPGVLTVRSDVEEGQDDGAEDQLDPPAHEQWIDLVAVAVQGHERGVGDGAVF
ncbi:hypothetical protein GCM10010207_56860 [Streptomyces atratus]|nr:hypothetical protein GCM10010207_56860 [Streptomyces atratus]